jgi:hypothetical protein
MSNTQVATRTSSARRHFPSRVRRVVKRRKPVGSPVTRIGPVQNQLELAPMPSGKIWGGNSPAAGALNRAYLSAWLWRVIDHEAVLMDPQVSGVVETGVWTADKQPVALFLRKNDWIVQVIPQQAIKAIRVLSARKIVTRRQELGWELFTTALGLYGGVLWSGELQGFIIHKMMPGLASYWLLAILVAGTGTSYLIPSWAWVLGAHRPQCHPCRFQFQKFQCPQVCIKGLKRKSSAERGAA